VDFVSEIGGVAKTLGIIFSLLCKGGIVNILETAVHFGRLGSGMAPLLLALAVV